VNQTGQPSVGPALTNTSVVTQSAVANATVGQNGSNNRSGIDQSGTNAAATLSQDGSFLTSDIIQTAGATATTSQRGTGNTAMVTQDAIATSTVEQGLINTASSGNSATVQQQAGSAGSFSEVRQDGIGNSAGVLQTAANNDSFVRVEGNSNSATVTQNGSGNAQRVRVVGDPALGDGTPTGNVAITTQTATAHDNWSSTAQQGDNNRVEITQSGVGVRVATQTDRSYNNYRFNEPPEADVWQVSDNNKAYIDQASDASRVTIYQGLEQVPVGTGSYKYALGGNNEARVTQLASADNSRADVIQGGSNHIANVTQSGLNSDSYVNQAGTGHTATVSQTGSDNDSFLVQFGTGNTATVTQASNNNVSTIDQSGSSNTVTVTQGL
jgi:hypothetical protein